MSITGSSGANFEQLATTGTVTNTVVDDLDSTTVTLSSLTNGAALTEGGSITYAASVGAAVAGSPLVLTLSNGQSITIPVGQSTGSVTFTLRPDDALVQGTDSLCVSITGSSGANFEQLATTGTVTNTVVDDLDSTTVTLSSLTNGAALTEGGSITYAASVGAAVAGSPLVLTLSNGQSITIPVGQSTGSVTFTLRPDDALVQGTDSLSVSITGSSGANFEHSPPPAPSPTRWSMTSTRPPSRWARSPTARPSPRAAPSPTPPASAPLSQAPRWCSRCPTARASPSRWASPPAA